MTGYRTLFVGTLVQDSAFGTGGGSRASGHVDAPIARDGRGRPVLQGDGLAGALVATARKLVADLPRTISGDPAPARGTRAYPSLWGIPNSHPSAATPEFCQGAATPELRQGVGIRQATDAAAHGVLFDMEVLPRGTSWDLLVDVDTSRPGAEAKAAEDIAAAALLEWTRGRCWIGHDVARGLGWMTLTVLRAYRLDAAAGIDLWPDSSRCRDVVLRDVAKAADEGGGMERIEAADFAGAFALPPADGRWHYVEIEGTVRAGDHADGYGLDALSVGAHAGVRHEMPSGRHLLGPRGRDPARAQDDAPDLMIAMTRGADGVPRPFLPGSGLRGPLRHGLSRLLRRNDRGRDIRDPNDGSRRPEGAPTDDVEALFGHVEHSASLLVRDAYVASDDWVLARLQHHAGDEFAGGVFGPGKFDRMVLIKGEFSWKLVIEAEGEEAATALLERLKRILRMAEAGHVPIGGAKWRGAGWARWRVGRVRTGRAGEDWLEQHSSA